MWRSMFGAGRRGGSVAKRKQNRPLRPALGATALRFESLEDRQTPAIAASFTGAISLVAGSPVNVSKLTLDQNQPNIALDPTNPARMFAISNTTSTGLFGAYSTNAGQTWSTRTVATGADGLPSASGDAQVAWDNFGNLFLTYIKQGTNSTIVGLSTDGGQSFTTKLDSATANDQPSLAVGNGMVVVAFNRAGTMRSLSASVSGLGSMGGFGLEQSVAGTGNFGNVAIGPAGQVMMTWTQALGTQNAESIFCAVDTDGLGFGGYGATTTVTSTNVGSSDAIPAQAARHIDSEPNVAFDSLGRVYIAYTDESPNESNDTNIFVRTSDDNGATWSAAVKVNNDATTKSQFLPSIAVDRDTGFVAVSWYDARNSAGNNTAQVYGSVSVDRGATFLANQQIGPGVSNSASSPSSFDFGDYSGISYTGGSFFPVWADNSNSTGDNPAGGLASFDVYTARTRVQSVGGQTVTLTGTAGIDTYNIRTDATGTYVMFFENNPAMTGKPSFIATKASLQKIIVNAGDGDDIVTVDTSFGDPIPAGGMDYDGGVGVDSITAIGDKDFFLSDFSLGISGNPTINLSNVNKAVLTGGSSANNFWAGGWSGVVDMNGGGGSDLYAVDVYYLFGTFNVNDTGGVGTDKLTINGTSGVVTTVYANSIEGGFGNFVSYAGVERLEIDADGAGDVINVRSTSIKTNIVGGSGTSVNIGDATGVQNILGAVNMENPSFFNSIAINDGVDTTARSVSISNMGNNPDDAAGFNSDWAVIGGISPANIYYQYQDTSTINVNAGTGADTFFILSNSSAFAHLTINGGLGADQFAIYGASYGADSIIDLNGQEGADSFFVMTPVAVGTSVTVSGGADADKLFGHAGLVNWNINAGTGIYNDFDSGSNMNMSGLEWYLANSAAPNNFYVRSTAAGTKTMIVAAANNSYVIVGNNTNGTQDILGTVNIENPQTFSVVIVDDSADSVGRTVNVTNFFGNPDSQAGANNIYNKLSGIAPADININDADSSSLTIMNGSGADTINVTPAVQTPIIVQGGSPGFPNLTTADWLNINVVGTNNQLLTSTANGAGNWVFGNRANLDFVGIERMTPGKSISGRVFSDLNNNGIDDAEPGIAGVIINIDPLAGGNLALQATTAADGSYSFTDLAPCTYRIRQIVPGGYTQTTANPADLTFAAPINSSNIKFGDHSTGDVTAPTIVSVYFDGSTWTSGFRTAAGNATYGYAAQTGGGQLTSMPWSTVNTVYVKFSENVQVDFTDLNIRGINVANYGISSFSYDGANFVGKWTLTNNIDTDRLIVDLDGDSATAVKDLAGNKLAGSWTDSISTFPSNGAAGADFKFHFVIAVGDADRNGVLRNADTNVVRGNLFVDAGQAGYNMFADIDGNGLVRNADTNLVRSHLFIDPPGGPGPNRPLRGGGVNPRSAVRTFESKDNSNEVSSLRLSAFGHSSEGEQSHSVHRAFMSPVVETLDALFSDF